MTERNGSKGINQFTKDVLYDVLVSWTSKALGAAAVALVSVMVALIVTRWDVPAWTLVVMALLAITLLYLTRRVAGREANELRPKLGAAEKELDRHDSYGSNICSGLDTFQKIVAKDINMTMSGFIEQTISTVAFQKKVPQVWKDAPAEERGFVGNPKATRGFKSMVSIPILLGGKTAGVFNVLTDEKDTFDPADINYLTSLGSIIQLAFGLALKEIEKPKSQPQRRATPARVGGPRRAAGTLPSVAPRGSVGSSDTTDGKETSDE